MLSLRLSAAVEATYAATSTSEAATVGVEAVRPGVAAVTVTGVAAGEARIDLVATAAGYQEATAGFDVEIRQPQRFGAFTGEDVFGCSDFDQMDDIVSTALTGDLLLLLALLSEAALSGACANFKVGDEIRWDGEERSFTALPEFTAIRVWASGLGADGQRSPPQYWWVAKADTSLYERGTPTGPPPPPPPPGEPGSITNSDGTFGCASVEDYDELVRLIAVEDDFEILFEFVTEKLRAGGCGAFEAGDEIVWQGVERAASVSDAFVGIYAWGIPVIGVEGLTPSPGWWWIPKFDTSFANGAAALDAVRAVRDRLRRIPRH